MTDSATGSLEADDGGECIACGGKDFLVMVR